MLIFALIGLWKPPPDRPINEYSEHSNSHSKILILQKSQNKIGILKKTYLESSYIWFLVKEGDLYHLDIYNLPSKTRQLPNKIPP